jgi:hypothetical protein
MTTIDYDAPRRSTDEPEEDNAEELQSRRPPQSPMADLDQPDAVEGFALPGEELTGEEPTMSERSASCACVPAACRSLSRFTLYSFGIIRVVVVGTASGQRPGGGGVRAEVDVVAAGGLLP